MGRLERQVALITGAGSGTGRATVILFAKEGAKIAVVDRRPSGGSETLKQITASGGEATFVESDVS